MNPQRGRFSGGKLGGTAVKKSFIVPEAQKRFGDFFSVYEMGGTDCMRSVTFSDQTMLTAAARAAGFRQKLEAARKLDHLGLTCVEMPKLSGQEADVLLMRSLCSTVKRGVLALHTGITVDDVKLAWEAIKGAEQPRLIISMPLTRNDIILPS